jgi:hypothetical protein
MSFFSFFKKDKKKEDAIKPILGMPLLLDANSLNIKGIVNTLRQEWHLIVDDTQAGDETSVLMIDGYSVAIGLMSVAIPGDEVKKASEYQYFWENAADEIEKHKAHVILSIINAGKEPVKENILYSKVVAAVLKNSDAIGIYIGGRSLVLSKSFYLTNVNMAFADGNDGLPLYTWIYFGLRQEGNLRSVYTYGLAAFNKTEMEIIGSTLPFDDLSDMMYNITSYVLAYNVNLKDGETIGLSAEQKLKISLSQGKFLEGKTLKINY